MYTAVRICVLVSVYFTLRYMILTFFLLYADYSDKYIIHAVRNKILCLLNKKEDIFKHISYDVEKNSGTFSSKLNEKNYLVDEEVILYLRVKRILRNSL